MTDQQQAHNEHHEGSHNHRETFEIHGAEVFTESHMHDQAATVSLAICPNEGATFAFATLVTAMQDIASRAEAAGGIIGHIKAFAREENGAFAHASVTAAGLAPTCEGDVSASFGEEADIQLVSIVLLISFEELLSICRDVLG